MSKKSQYITNQGQLDAIDRLKKEYELSKIVIETGSIFSDQLRIYAYVGFDVVGNVKICSFYQDLEEHHINNALEELEDDIKDHIKNNKIRSQYRKEVF